MQVGSAVRTIEVPGFVRKVIFFVEILRSGDRSFGVFRQNLAKSISVRTADPTNRGTLMIESVQSSESQPRISSSCLLPVDFMGGLIVVVEASPMMSST